MKKFFIVSMTSFLTAAVFQIQAQDTLASKSIDSLEPGDLLYFGYINREGVERITHTGMYIGNTEVIHSSGMVRINSLDSTRSNYSSYLGKGLRGARRIIGTESARGTEQVALHNWYREQK